MGIELKEPALIRQIEQLADETTLPVEQVLEAAIRTYLDSLEREAIQAETRLFWAMYDELVPTYSGQHIALYQGKVIDHDEDVSRLEKRIRKQMGLLPVLIAPVKSVKRRELKWRGGRFEKLEAA